MKRFEERIADFNNALNRLKEAVSTDKDPTELEIDGTLQRFEFTFELAWKCMKDYLEKEGVSFSLGSPRDVIQNAFKYHLIDDGEAWIDMMLSRNDLSHLYDDAKSREIYEKIKGKYIGLLDVLIEKLKQE